MSTRHDIVKNAPTLLHAIALVEPTLQATVANIRRMDLGLPPNLYEPSKQLVHAVLGGQPVSWALGQVPSIPDPKQRSSAQEVLLKMRPYLEGVRPVWFRQLDVEYFQVSRTLQVPIRFNGIMNFGNGFRVFLLHPWRRRLSLAQNRAGLTMLHSVMRRRPELRDAALDFVDVSVDPVTGEREYRHSGWDSWSEMSADELSDFAGMLAAAWTKYHSEGTTKPSPPKRPPGGQPDLFADPKK